jgi:cysteine synthase
LLAIELIQFWNASTSYTDVLPAEKASLIEASNDVGIALAREVARTEGVPVGISSGAALKAAIEVSKRPENASKTLVVIIPSFAERYLSTALFDGLE